MYFRNRRFSRSTIAVALASALLLLIAVQPAHAQTETVLYSFNPNNGVDGAYPYAAVVMDKKGNLYATTTGGGAYGYGTVFQLSPNGSESVLYSFCSQANCLDGSYPRSSLILDKLGNLYGTTEAGGANNSGTVFKLTPSGAESVLYNFCSVGNCLDGASPVAGLIADKQGNLYGTTVFGGNSLGGVEFKLTPNGTYTVLNNDGGKPVDGLIMDKLGNLYGTTQVGGANGYGKVFEISSSGVYTWLYSFCSQPGCLDGSYPQASVIMDKKGNLYGTTVSGGNSFGGVEFKLSSKGIYTVLNNDGGQPYAGLTMDKIGFYGTTYLGGAYGYGKVFELSAGGNQTWLYSFNPNSGDGFNPYAALIRDKAGNLYGTTFNGGAYGYGTVFRFCCVP